MRRIMLLALEARMFAVDILQRLPKERQTFQTNPVYYYVRPRKGSSIAATLREQMIKRCFVLV
jgi:hypothetical protein